MNPSNRPRRTVRLRSVENQAITAFRIFEDRSDFGKLFLGGNEFKIDPEFILKRGPILGNGNGGKVFQTNLEGMLIARKDIEILTQNNEKELKNFMREIEATRECSACPFIVQYFGYYIHRLSPILNIYIFMEKMPISASHLISRMKQVRTTKKNAKIPEYVLGRIVCSVIHALKFLKKYLKMMHRDIKPANILMDYDGRVKVCDFGICGVLVNSKAESKCGSIPYLAPERFSLEPYDVKSDFWALGITVVELATLINPYFASQHREHDIVTAVINQPSPSLNKDEFSASLIDFLSRVLEKNPANRPGFDEFEKLPFFAEHDIPFSFIGTGTRPRRNGDPECESIPRLSVGQWLDELLLDKN